MIDVLNKMQPEEFDPVILGGGTGSTIAHWDVLPVKDSASRLSNANTLADRARTLPVCAAKT